jgi:protein-S-isoprenylcysteine O-methyltransferase Ste14
MARPGFKRVWTRFVPMAAERSTYMLAASLALMLVFWAWRPLPQLFWSIDQAAVATILSGAFILAFLAAPQMSLGHLVFAGVMTAHILIAIGFEERDLMATFGERYLRYRQSVGMFWPKIRPRADDRAA